MSRREHAGFMLRRSFMFATFLAMAFSMLNVSLSAGDDFVIPTVEGEAVTLPTDVGHVLFLPKTLDIRCGHVDLLIHFHGDPATVRNNAGYAGVEAAVLTVNYPGLSSAYRKPFENAAFFAEVSEAARAVLRDRYPAAPPIALGRIGVSSFSAGYGAVRELLKRPEYVHQIDALLLADSLYASFESEQDSTPRDEHMEGFRAFAQSAAREEKVMIVTHSQVLTHTYANTAETADDLLRHVGVEVRDVDEKGLGALRFFRRAEVGGFSVWGAAGDDGDAHMAHLRYIGQWLSDLELGVKVP